ncbi:beta-mannanase-like protein [Planoprotostelium fungivorum]|uniref:Beta-mannanase-like protein n=1 Tax=Planoprotostelium fungivorum TaxID=1890364 RepID=A0A2P6N2D9_9EUKA|nr:beta-mannanase-like protein [Planoprotostelium fungivorum]
MNIKLCATPRELNLSSHPIYGSTSRSRWSEAENKINACEDQEKKIFTSTITILYLTGNCRLPVASAALELTPFVSLQMSAFPLHLLLFSVDTGPTVVKIYIDEAPAHMARLLLCLCLLGSVISAGANYICNNVAWGSVTLPVYDSNTISSTVSLDTAIGRSSQIVQYYVNWADGYLGDNAAAPDFSKWGDFPKWINAAKSFSSVGLSQHVPLITWQPWGSPYTNANTKYSYSTISAGTWDSYVDSFGRVMNSFNSTIYIRFAHEFDGDWYPWGAVNGNTGAGFIAAWRRVYTRVMAVAPKVQFVWCPNNSNGKGVKFEDYYPGDQYVHWMCLDAYADSTTNSFADTITKDAIPAQPYQRLTALSAKKPIMIAEFGVNNMGENRDEEGKRERLTEMTVQGSISQGQCAKKPIMIAEFGVNNMVQGSISQGQWYQNMADSLASSFPQIKAVVHFDVAHSDRSWKIDTSNSGLTSQIKTAWGCNGGINSLTSWGNISFDGILSEGDNGQGQVGRGGAATLFASIILTTFALFLMV